MSELRAVGAFAPEPPPEGYAYLEKYVAFLDILGFSDVVEKADQDPELRRALAKVLHIFQTTCGTNPTTGTRVTQFSDSLVITAARTEQGLHSVLSGCEWLAMNLIQYAVLLRGGVAVGRVSHEDHILFGIGVNRAYQFEKSGEPPRIALAADVVADIDGYPYFRDRAVWTADPASGHAMLHPPPSRILRRHPARRRHRLGPHCATYRGGHHRERGGGRSAGRAASEVGLAPGLLEPGGG